MKIIRKIKWLLKDKPMIKYPGYNCGLCGRWIDEEFEVPEWASYGQWWDTWGICEGGCNEFVPEISAKKF